MTNQFLRVIAVVCGLATTTFAAQIPLPTTLESLLNTTDFISVGGLNFDTFAYSKTNDMPSAANINVLAHVDNAGNAGLRFQGGFIDTDSPEASDSLITFTVTATGPMISSANLTGNPDLLGGQGRAAVTETFTQVNNDSLSIFDNGSIEQLTDSINFASPIQQLQVQKDIILLAEAGSAGAAISFVDQTFAVVPEPASLGGLAVGCLAMLMLRRRRNR